MFVICGNFGGQSNLKSSDNLNKSPASELNKKRGIMYIYNNMPHVTYFKLYRVLKTQQFRAPNNGWVGGFKI